MRDTDLKERIRDAARAVAKSNDLTPGHGTNRFVSMTVETFERATPAITEKIEAEVKAGIEAELTRMSEILKSPEAKSRMDMALELAFESGMEADKAIKLMASSPKPITGPSALSQAMRGNSPGISSDDGSLECGSDQDEEQRAAQTILNAG